MEGEDPDLLGIHAAKLDSDSLYCAGSQRIVQFALDFTVRFSKFEEILQSKIPYTIQYNDTTEWNLQKP